MRKLWCLLFAVSLLVPLGCADKPDAENAENKGGDTETAGGDGSGSTPSTADISHSEAKSVMVSVPKAVSELGYVPEDAALLISIQPQDILNSPLMSEIGEQERMQLSMGLSMFELQSGIKPEHIERISIALWPGQSSFMPPQAAQMGVPEMDGGVIIRFSQPVKLDTIKAKAEQMGQKLNEQKIGEITYLAIDGDEAPVGMAMPNDNTLMIATENAMKVMLGPKSKGELLSAIDGNTTDQTFALVARFNPFRNELKQLAQQAPRMPDAPDANDLAENLNGLMIAVDYDKNFQLKTKVDAKNADTVQKLKDQFDKLREQIGQAKDGQMATLKDEFNEDLAGEIKTLANKVYDSLQASVDGETMTVSLSVPESAQETMKKVQKFTAARFITQNSAKQIALAFHNFHDTYRQAPFTSPDPDNQNTKLSWRVRILPFLEQANLYEQFKLDEPWDSEHNKALLEQMPEIYKVSDDAEPGHTQFVVPKGKGMAIDGDKKIGIRDITDGTVNTLFVVTVKPEHAVPWTAPDDLDVALDNIEDTMKKLGGVRDGFIAAFFDGRVSTLNTENIKPDTMKALFTVGGGEVINEEDYDPEAAFDFDVPADADFELEPVEPDSDVEANPDVELKPAVEATPDSE